MTREQLAHVLRAAAEITKDGEILVIGSQSILGTYSENQLPKPAVVSMEADIAFQQDPDVKKADQVDGAIGEDSRFHETHGYYGQGVELSTAILPAGWRDRVVSFERPDAEAAKAKCLEPHDLIISKLVAGREKDIDFTIALIAARLVDITIIKERANLLEQPGAVIKRVQDAITRCSRI